MSWRTYDGWVPGDEEDDLDEGAEQDEVDSHIARLEAAEDEDNAKH